MTADRKLAKIFWTENKHLQGRLLLADTMTSPYLRSIGVANRA